MEAAHTTAEPSWTTRQTPAFDPFYSAFGQADAWPRWLRLRRDVRVQLEKLMADSSGELPLDLEERLKAVNQSIAEYNDHVPNVYLRKPMLTAANWEEQYDEWQ